MRERDRPGFEIVQCHCSQTRAIREAPAPVADEWTVVVYDSVHVLLILRPQFHVSFGACKARVAIVRHKLAMTHKHIHWLMHAHLPSLERQTELTALLQLMERIMVLLSSNDRIVTRLSAPAPKVYPGFVNGRSANTRRG